jgi:hypothetical protein
VVAVTAITPDAEQAAELQARRLLELAGAYVRVALRFPDEVTALRTLAAELLLEVSMLRGRLEALERRVGR